MLRHTIACYATQSVTYLASWEGSPAFFMWNVNNVSANYDQFSQDLRTLLDSKRVQAAAGGSLRKFAAGNATAPNNQTLYSLVQCTPDLSDQDCSDCLAGAMGDIPNCCDGKQGGRVIRPSCNLRFEVALFYDPTADNASSPSLSPPPPPVPSVSPPASNNTPAAKGKSVDEIRSVESFQGDVKPDLCRSCLNKATDLPLRCPNQKEAIGWYYYCMLRYSFRDIFGILEISPPSYLCKGNDLSANYDQFCQDLRNLLDSQRGRAAAGGSLRKFAAGNATAPDNQTLYSLVQCTPDLSDQDCSDCLFGAMEDVRNYCSGIQRGSVFKPSCNLRFDVVPFYDDPPASNNTPAAKGKESNKSQTVIIVVPIISSVVLIIISFYIYLRVRKPREKPQSEFGDEIRSVESLQLGFGTIKVATYDFSDANKLGQAGFGVVYKGKLSDGQVIAVKRLSKNSSQGDLEFKNEVFLDNFIFDPIKSVLLDWARRYKIIGGIARDLLYLHEDSRLLKPIQVELWGPSMEKLETWYSFKSCKSHIGGSYSITLPIPSQPAFFMNSGTKSNICLQSKSSSIQASLNEVSITELSPR
nr:cysteine-rich receptor-like protein kinase 29 [Quercus suber]